MRADWPSSSASHRYAPSLIACRHRCVYGAGRGCFLGGVHLCVCVSVCVCKWREWGKGMGEVCKVRDKLLAHVGCRVVVSS